MIHTTFTPIAFHVFHQKLLFVTLGTILENIILYNHLHQINSNPPPIPFPETKNPEAALLPRGRLGLRHPRRHPLRRHARPRTPGAQFNSDSENDSENVSEILPKSYIKKFKNLKFRHVQKLGRILRIAIELTP